MPVKKADPRTKVFRFRINDAEDRRFREIARNRGVDRADLIREVLGLNYAEADAMPLPPTPASVPTEKPDPQKEPGAAAVVEIAERIQRKKGKSNGR